MTPDTDQTGPTAEAIAEALNHCRQTAAIDPTEPHYFKFSKNWSDGRRGGRRLCGACGLNYDDGPHIEITTLKPFTHYACISEPAGSQPKPCDCGRQPDLFAESA